MCLKGGSGMSNSVDPDQTPRSLTFDLSLYSGLSVRKCAYLRYGNMTHVTMQQEGSARFPRTPGISLSLSVSLHVTCP